MKKISILLIAAFLFISVGCTSSEGLTDDTSLVDDMQWTTGSCAGITYEYPAELNYIEDELFSSGFIEGSPFYMEYENEEVYFKIAPSSLRYDANIEEEIQCTLDDDVFIIDEDKEYKETIINGKQGAIAYGEDAEDAETGESIAYIELFTLEKGEKANDDDISEIFLSFKFSDNKLDEKDWQLASRIVNSIKEKDENTVENKKEDGLNDTMRTEYLNLLSNNYAAISEDHIKANKTSQMTALYDIDGDSKDELFMFIPNEDGVPHMHIFSYANGETRDVVYEFYDRWEERVSTGGLIANTVVVDNGVTVYMSKDKNYLYIYNSDPKLMETYEVSKYEIIDTAKLPEIDHFADYYLSDEQRDEYYQYADEISEEEFVTLFHNAADDMGDVIINTADDGNAVSNAAMDKECVQKKYGDMIDYLKQ